MLEYLQSKPQWLLWRYVTVPGKSKATKLPVRIDGTKASVTNPGDWRDYAIVRQQWTDTPDMFDGLGYVITDDDDLTCIDLDASDDPLVCQMQQQVHDAFDSYSERSPSKKGLHIWLRGKVPQNRVFKNVEIYTRAHYITVTFDPWNNKPIERKQKLLDDLYTEMLKHAPLALPVKDREQKYSDLEVYNQCIESNGDIFTPLWEGDWENIPGKNYDSQSEADFALINIISYHSRNMQQIERMFMNSGAAERYRSGKKVKSRRYIGNMIARSFDLTPSDVDLKTLKEQIDKEFEDKSIARKAANAMRIAHKATNYDLPEGLMGLIAKYVHDQSPHPFQEIALGAAIGLMAGVCGRAYNVIGQGLNQYVVVLAGTGIGKETGQGGINKLVEAAFAFAPSAHEYIGPASLSSGQALIKALGQSNSFVSMLSEFGFTLQNLSAHNANSSMVTLRQSLLELYGRSGQGSAHHPTVYSDKSKDTNVLKAPAFSIFAESTDTEFYRAVDESTVMQGLLPRFTVLQYEGERPYWNTESSKVQPSDELIAKLASLMGSAAAMNSHNKVIDVKFEPGLEERVVEFNHWLTDEIRRTDNEVEKSLWSRVFMKVVKLAALVAVGVNETTPVVTETQFQWAKRLAMQDIKIISKRFDEGMTGKDTSEVLQKRLVYKIVHDYMMRPFDVTMESYGTTLQMKEQLAIPMSYMSRRLLNKGSFKNDHVGANNALYRALKGLVEDGVLKEMRPGDVATRFGRSGRTFQITEVQRFIPDKTGDD